MRKSLEYIYIKWKEETDLEDCDEGGGVVVVINGDILRREEHEGSPTTIGWLRAVLYLGNSAENLGLDLIDQADSLDQDAYDFAATVCNYNTEQYKWLESRIVAWSECSNFLMLDRIWIREEFRGKGIGKAVIRSLVMRQGYGCCMIGLLPAPLTADGCAVLRGDKGDGLKKKTARLRRYYRRIGFSPLVNSKYMIMDLTSLKPLVLLGLHEPM